MTSLHQPIDLLLRRLSDRSPLNDQDRLACKALGGRERDLRTGQYLVREGQLPIRCGFILSGYACRQKLTSNGDRAIIALLLPGDFVDLQNMFLIHSDHDVLALTPVHLLDFTVAEVHAVAMSRINVARAMWIDCLVEASILREWLLNIGRRDARTRLAHLVCELHVRHRQSVPSYDGTFVLPMTQEQLGDALGLTPVHVNRMLQHLERDGLIARERRSLKVTDWRALCDAGDFNDRYLHFLQTEA